MPKRARLTSRPIPVTPQSWMVEVNGVRALLLKLKALQTDNGKKWVDGVGAYYKRRLRDLMAYKPKSLIGKR